MGVLRINQNPIAINANRNLKVTGMAISKSLERLSSGLRINRAADDAAGLSISEKLRAQIRGLNRASANALDGISLIQTAEGALNEIHTILQRMRELAVQAANGIYTADDRQSLQLEITQLTDEINRIANTTEFNSKNLLDGTLGALISTDDFTRIRAAVVGNVGDGGNFVLKAVAKTTGQLQIQKTDVFTTTQQTDAVGQINYLATWRADATVTTAGSDGIGNTGMYQIEVPVNPNGSIAVNSATNATLRISGAIGATGADTLGQNFQVEELTVGDKIVLTLNTANGIRSVSVAVAALTDDNNTLAANMSTALTTFVSAVTFNAANNRFEISFSVGGISIINTQFVDTDKSGSNFYISFNSATSAR
jgi:flagellin